MEVDLFQQSRRSWLGYLADVNFYISSDTGKHFFGIRQKGCAMCSSKWNWQCRMSTYSSIYIYNAFQEDLTSLVTSPRTQIWTLWSVGWWNQDPYSEVLNLHHQTCVFPWLTRFSSVGAQAGLCESWGPLHQISETFIVFEFFSLFMFFPLMPRSWAISEQNFSEDNVCSILTDQIVSYGSTCLLLDLS